jgi:hypothetical protein
LTRFLGASLVAAMIAGISLPDAVAASIHHNASDNHHKASSACKNAIGTYVVGTGGVISGTITLTTYTSCGTVAVPTLTAGSFWATWAPPRSPEAKVSNTAGSDNHADTHATTPGKGKGEGGKIHNTGPVTDTTTLTPTTTISLTSVLSTTGTFVQDPAHPKNPAAVLVTGSASIGQLGFVCQGICPAIATVAVTQTVTFASVPGLLSVQKTGKSTKADLTFRIPLSSLTGPSSRPVHLMGRRASS